MMFVLQIVAKVADKVYNDIADNLMIIAKKVQSPSHTVH